MKIIKYLISVLGLWLIVSVVSDGQVPFIVPVLNQVVKDYDKLVVHIGYSSFRVIAALLFSVILGTSIAVLMVRSKLANQFLNPFVISWYPIPKAALTPVFIIVLGLGEFAKIGLLVFVTIFPVIIAVRKSILNFPSQYNRIISVYAISDKDLIFKIYLRGAARELLVTAKLVVGIAVAVLYLSESSFGTANGIGYYISRNMGVNQAGVITGIVMLSLFGVCLFKVIDLLESKYIKW